jgi:hypothetical protein
MASKKRKNHDVKLINNPLGTIKSLQKIFNQIFISVCLFR